MLAASLAEFWHFNERCSGFPTETFMVRRDEPPDDAMQLHPFDRLVRDENRCGTSLVGGKMSRGLTVRTELRHSRAVTAHSWLGEVRFGRG